MIRAFDPNGVVTLTTDFGLDDAYVAIMKGVILSIAPHARIIDYSHGITPGNVIEAAYLLRNGYCYFPRGTIHVVVVDPGVGTQRRAVAIQTPDHVFVGPDNGVLTPIVEDAQAKASGDVQVVELTEARFWLPDISATFHGRDIFAPTAAHLLGGTPLSALGRTLDQLTPAPVVEPYAEGPHTLIGRIIHVDRFGNCITNITEQHLQQSAFGQHILIEITDQQLPGLFRTYADGPTGTPMCLIGSSGHLEFAVCNGSAAQYLGVDIGDKFRVRRMAERHAALA